MDMKTTEDDSQNRRASALFLGKATEDKTMAKHEGSKRKIEKGRVSGVNRTGTL